MPTIKSSFAVKAMKDLFYGICAGILIGIGGAVFLASENRVIGAILFSVALICICAKGYSLYTGKVGYLAFSHRTGDFKNLAFCFLGNLIGTFAAGNAIRFSQSALFEKAAALCETKLTQSVPSALIRALFCGILMYLAVSVYREKNTYIGILCCVPVFILAGFEHSIADLFYFFAAGIYSRTAVCYLTLIVLGNSAGGLFFPVLSILAEPHTNTQGEAK